MVLYIGFAFLFNFILVSVLPQIIASFDLERAFNSIALALENANESLESLGYGFTLIPEYLLDPAFYSGATNEAAVKVFSFVVASLLAFLISYGITWLIYGLTKKFSQKFKDLITKINEKKAVKFPLGIVSSLLCAVAFIVFTFTPLNKLAEGVNKPLDNISSIQIEEKFEEEFAEADKVVGSVNEIKGRLGVFDSEVGTLYDLFKDYEDIFYDYDSNYKTLKAELSDFENDIDLLREKNLSYSERITLEGVGVTLDELKLYYPQIDKVFTDADALLSDADKQIDEGMSQLNEAKNFIDENLQKYNEVIGKINELTSTIEEVQGGTKEVNEILNTYFDSSWFDWLLSVDFYPYFDFEYQNENHNLIDELGNIDSSLTEFIDDNVVILKDIIKDGLEDVKAQIADSDGQFEEYEKLLEEAKLQVDELKPQVDEIIQTADELILLFESGLDAARVAIDELKANYGIN